MKEKLVCQHEILERFNSYLCGKPAKMEFEGKGYCGRHDPIKKAKKREERQAKWEKQYAEAKERHHRKELMEKILGNKSTEELERIAKEIV